jgi:hypothetical protein
MDTFTTRSATAQTLTTKSTREQKYRTRDGSQRFPEALKCFLAKHSLLDGFICDSSNKMLRETRK